MAYDAATRSVVLFGGDDAAGADPTGTWTWNGSTWTKQHPATHPPATVNASMAYDAATRNIVLFGGSNTRLYSDTWTWNGSAWTKQSPATHPSGRSDASMAYDAATRNIVLFGGFANTGTGSSAATWTWDGSTWTRQSPATHPPATVNASMAYDAATGNIVLFGGVKFGGVSANVQQNLGDTWTWNGSTWTKQSPATHPTARYSASMAYDAATHSIVLFSGFNRHGLDSTWTWG